MKLLINLASIILISLPLVAQATVTSEKVEASIQNFESKLGRELDANEFKAMEQLLSDSSPTQSSPLIKTGGRSYYGSEADIDGPTSLKMGCFQIQFSIIGSGKALLCLSEDGSVYRVLAADVGALLQVNASLILIVVSGSKNIVSKVRNGESTIYEFDGIGASAYWFGGVQAHYYKGPSGSTMVMAGGGLGFGGGITFAGLPSIVIAKW